MQPLRLDHLLTFVAQGDGHAPDVRAHDVRAQVEPYRRLGFDVTDEIRPYQPGLLNRFVQFGIEYLELVSVVDEAAFAQGGAVEFGRMFADLPALRAGARPFSIGFVCADVNALHADWSARGFDLPAVWSFAPPGMPPVLSFQQIPAAQLPGVSGFAITYHGGPAGGAVRVRRAANGIYALDGVALVSETPESDAAQWQTLLNPTGAVGAQGGVFEVSLPPHRVWWMTPDEFQGRYGVAWQPAPHRFGAIGAIHLLADDLEMATAKLGLRARRRVGPVGQEPALVVTPTDNDGVTVVIRAYPSARWRDERAQVTGERIELV